MAEAEARRSADELATTIADLGRVENQLRDREIGRPPDFLATWEAGLRHVLDTGQPITVDDGQGYLFSGPLRPGQRTGLLGRDIG